MTIGYTCQSPQPVIPLNFKTDNLKTEEIFAFFNICHTFIDGVDLMQFALKIRTHAVTIEAYIANQLVGFCACYMNDYNTQTAYITHIAISSEYRGKGYGKQLLEKTIAIAQEHGFQKLNLEVLKTNLPALALYQSHDFTIIEDRNTKYLMSLHLADKSG